MQEDIRDATLTHINTTHSVTFDSVVNISNPKPNPLLGTLSLKERVVSQMCVLQTLKFQIGGGMSVVIVSEKNRRTLSMIVSSENFVSFINILTVFGT